MFFQNVLIFLVFIAILLVAVGVYRVLLQLMSNQNYQLKNKLGKNLFTLFSKDLFLVFIFSSFLVPTMLWLIKNYHP